jgi:hypothetical protein
MRTNFVKPSLLIALTAIIIFMLSSCTKEKVTAPAPQQSSLTSDDALQVGEIVAETVTPGTYTVLRFIDTGDDETAQFNGYTFQFQADGDLIARRNGQVFNGRWRLNSAETRMTIIISGTAALNDLDDDNWRVNRLTNQRISLSKPGPDRVVFVMQ